MVVKEIGFVSLFYQDGKVSDEACIEIGIDMVKYLRSKNVGVTVLPWGKVNDQLRNITIDFLEEMVLSKKIELKDIPFELRAACGSILYSYGIRAVRNSDEQVKQIYDLIRSDLPRITDEITKNWLERYLERSSPFE